MAAICGVNSQLFLEVLLKSFSFVLVGLLNFALRLHLKNIYIFFYILTKFSMKLAAFQQISIYLLKKKTTIINFENCKPLTSLITYVFFKK